MHRSITHRLVVLLLRSQNRRIAQLLICLKLMSGAGNSMYANEGYRKLTHTNETQAVCCDSMHHLVGEVTDHFTKEDIQGATVKIENYKIKTTTNQLGLFELLIPGKLLVDTIRITICSLGYVDKTLTYTALDLPSIMSIELNLHRKPLVNTESIHCIWGTVVDGKTCETIPGAIVSLDKSTVTTSTDINGIFKLDISNQLQTDTVRMLISSLGYQDQILAFASRLKPLNSIIEMKQDFSNVMRAMFVPCNGTLRTASCFVKYPKPSLKYRLKRRLNHLIRNKKNKNA